MDVRDGQATLSFGHPGLGAIGALESDGPTLVRCAGRLGGGRAGPCTRLTPGPHRSQGGGHRSPPDVRLRQRRGLAVGRAARRAAGAPRAPGRWARRRARLHPAPQKAARRGHGRGTRRPGWTPAARSQIGRARSYGRSRVGCARVHSGSMSWRPARGRPCRACRQRRRRWRRRRSRGTPSGRAVPRTPPPASTSGSPMARLPRMPSPERRGRMLHTHVQGSHVQCRTSIVIGSAREGKDGATGGDA